MDNETDIESIHKDIATIKAEVDALQIAAEKESPTWYKDRSTIISVIALLFSFGTTAESLRRTYLQDIEINQGNLADVLRRLSEIPQEQVKNISDSSRNISAKNAIDIMLAQENSFLTAHARDIIDRIPASQVSASEYMSLGYAYMSAYSLPEAAENFLKSLDLAKDEADFNTEIGALRNFAYTEYLMGDPDSGARDFAQALDIFTRYPGYDPLTQTSVNVQTHVNWANSEMTLGRRDRAVQHLDAAEALVAGAAPSPATSRLNQTIHQARVDFGFLPSP